MFFLSDCVAQENTTGHLHLFWALGLSLNRVRPCKYFCEVDQERKGSFIAYEDRVSIHVLSFIFHDPMGPHPMMHFFFPLSLTWRGRCWVWGRNLLNICCVLGTQ